MRQNQLNNPAKNGSFIAGAFPECFVKFNLMVSTDCKPRSASHAFRHSSEFHHGAFPMSNLSGQFVFALVVVLASLAASFAQHAGLAATRKVPITTSVPSGVGKCFQGSPATKAAHNRAEFVHPGGVCWAPQDTTDGPGV
jgi:hypothetical protein